MSSSLLSPLLLLLLLALSQLAASAATCRPYNGKLCKESIPAGTQVESTIPSFTVELMEDLMLEQGFANLTDVIGSVDPLCSRAGAAALCAKSFKICNEFLNATIPTCESACTQFREYCGATLNATGESAQLDLCTFDATSDCHTVPFSSELPSNFECPSPLIPHPNPSTPNPNCLGLCCVPCEPNVALYPEGVWPAVSKLVLSLQIMSLILLIIFIITYLLMEEKRSYPSNIVTCIAFALSLFYLTVLFGVGDSTRVHCVDPATAATGLTNGLCRTQAIFVHYGIIAGCMWYLLLVINVYANVIFLSKRLRDFRRWFHLVCWVLPWVPVIIANATNRVGFTFGFWCITELGRYTTYALMIPLGICIFPSVIMNLHVLIRIAMVARNRNASIPAILRLQIRFFAFVMTVLVIFLYYWIQYESRLAHLGFSPDQPWLRDWFFCVMSGQGQNACAVLAAPFIPNIAVYTIGEVLIGILGFIVFGFFWTRVEVFNFWRATILGEKRKIVDPFNTSQNETSGTGRKPTNNQSQSRSNLSATGGEKDDLELS